MRVTSLAFLLGVSLILPLSFLPGKLWLWSVLIIAGMLYIFLPRLCKINCKWILVSVIGFCWALLQAEQLLQWHLPTDMQSKSIVITGIINTLPEVKNGTTSFVFSSNSLPLQTVKPVLLKLSWFSALPLHSGDRWQLTVRLKQPRGFWDAAAFDYQKWLFEQGVRATGYVVANGNNVLLSEAKQGFVTAQLRENIAAAVLKSLTNYPLAGLIAALAVGVRDQITVEQWAVLRGTGTNHLFAIAGLHIGFVIAAVCFIVNFLWRSTGRLSLYLPATQAAILAGLVSAIIYSALAGFSLPTQRALLMTAVFLLTTLWRKNLSSGSAWCLAMFLVLVFNPLAVLSDSFWLSFGAVALIIYGGSGRVQMHGIWWHWGQVQWVMAVGLIPLCLLFYQQIALAGFLANAIAIPWVGFVVLPLTLLGDLTWLFAPGGATILWQLAERALQLLWSLLELIATAKYGQWQIYLTNPWLLISAIIGVLLLLVPVGFYGRWLGFIWLLPLLLWTPAGPKAGEVWFSVLDVGQGLASIVRTQHHILIYDTGAKFNASFDAGSAVVVPVLRSWGLNTVDLLIVSHGDNDHIGGAAAIIEQLKVKQIISSVPQRFPPGSATLCYRGQNWQWDGVFFQVLYPPLGLDNLDNDSSCVVKITAGKHSILLSGDIERKSENYLVQNEPTLLAATILVAPHHGSNTSSTLNFINNIHPQYVLFPTGYLNRYKFPSPEVVARYQSVQALMYSTAEYGAINFQLTGQGVVQPPITAKLHFWDY